MSVCWLGSTFPLHRLLNTVCVGSQKTLESTNGLLLFVQSGARFEMFAVCLSGKETNRLRNSHWLHKWISNLAKLHDIERLHEGPSRTRLLPSWKPTNWLYANFFFPLEAKRVVIVKLRKSSGNDSRGVDPEVQEKLSRAFPLHPT